VHQATWGRGKDERGRGTRHADKEKERKRQKNVFTRRRMGSSREGDQMFIEGKTICRLHIKSPRNIIKNMLEGRDHLLIVGDCLDPHNRR
jgi:hypothetical protein